MIWQDICLRLGLALVLGIAIGIERQWRSRYVGLRTNTLIAIGSAGLVLFALMLPEGDPTALGRISAQIITGAGFLCAGVIIHEGFAAKGFSTAATLWCSVAVGLFCGMGHFMEAMILAAFIVLANLFLRPVVYLINHKTAGNEAAERPNHANEA